MENIVKAVTSVTDIMGEIASASSEQSKGISQVGQAVVEIDSVTQQNAALVEQSASASLEERARYLNQIVSIFQLATAGSAPKAVAVRKPVAVSPVPVLTAQKPSPKAEGGWETF